MALVVVVEYTADYVQILYTTAHGLCSTRYQYNPGPAERTEGLVGLTRSRAHASSGLAVQRVQDSGFP